MTVLQKVTQGASQRTPLLWTFNPFHWELSVRSSISGIFMLFTPTYRALVTVCTICHWPCKDACRTELVVIITLLWISHHKVAERVTFNFKLVESGLQCAVRIDRIRQKVSSTELPIIWIGHWIWVGMYVVHKMISVLFAIKLTQNFRLSIFKSYGQNFWVSYLYTCRYDMLSYTLMKLTICYIAIAPSPFQKDQETAHQGSLPHLSLVAWGLYPPHFEMTSPEYPPCWFWSRQYGTLPKTVIYI